MKEKRLLIGLLTFVFGALMVLGFSGQVLAGKSDCMDSASSKYTLPAPAYLTLHTWGEVVMM